MSSDQSLSAFAVRRLRLAGASVLEKTSNPWFKPLDQLQRDIGRDGGTLISFANYDYLGLSGNEAIQNAARAAVDHIGVGALGSRLVGGERLIHGDFEEALAKFVGTDSCLSLVSGYLTNLTTISHLMGRRDLILYDALSHNSIVAGIKACKADAVEFRHNDMDHLGYLLSTSRANYRNVLIVAESLYSMDGDIAHLPELVALKETHDCWLLVDEAHSIGVLGATGRGLCEHFDVDPNRIDIIVGTLSKTFASCGGFLCAQKTVLDWMRYTLPGFVYSVGLPPVIAAAAHAALDIIIAEPERVANLQAKGRYFLNRARAAGLATGPAEGHAIVPVMFPDLMSTMQASDYLMAQGIFAPPIVQVGVPKDLPRIRFFLSARHTEEEIDRTIGALVAFNASLPAPVPMAASL